MQISFNPNNTYSHKKSQNPSFQAIDQKWLAKIKANIDIAKLDFKDKISFLEISKQDGIDTYQEAKKYFYPNYQGYFDRLIKWAQDYVCTNPKIKPLYKD